MLPSLAAHALLSAALAQLGPELSFPPQSVGVAANGGDLVFAASAGNLGLVTWTDFRGPPAMSGLAYAARIDAAGTLLDPTDIPLTFRESYDDFPTCAFDGTDFLVAWTDEVNLGTWATRVSVDGGVSDFGGFLVAAAISYASGAKVAGGDGGWLVAWTDVSTPLAARIDAAGNVLDTPPIVLPLPQGAVAAAASDGTQFLVLTSNGALLTAIPVSGAGVAGVPGLLTSTAQGTAALAFDGTRFFAAWEDLDGGIEVGHVTSGGSLVEPAGTLVGGPAAFDSMIGMGSTASEAVVSWIKPGSVPIVQATLLDSAGTVLNQVAVTSDDGATGATVVGGNAIVVGNTVGAPGALAVALSWSGQVLSPGRVFLDRSEDTQQLQALATDGLDFLAMWTDATGSAQTVWLESIPSDGGGTAPAGPWVSDAGEFSEAALAAGGGAYLPVVALIAPDGGSPVLAGRVGADGAPLEALRVLGQGTWPSTAYAGGVFLVTWLAFGVPLQASLVGVRISSSGVLLDPSPLVLSTSAAYAPTTISTGGGEFLEVWSDVLDGGGTLGRAARVTAAGSVLDPGGLSLGGPTSAQAAFAAPFFWLVAVESDGGAQALHRWALPTDGGALVDQGFLGSAPGLPCAAIACTGQTCLASWEQTGSSTPSVFAALWTNAGATALDALAPAAGCPVVAADGDHFVVAWNTDSLNGKGGTIEAMIVIPDGGLPSAPLDVTGIQTYQSELALASNGIGTTLVGYDRFDVAPGASRTHARLLTDLPLSVTCTAPSQCASAQCGANGLCCDGVTTPCDGGTGSDGGSRNTATPAANLGCGCASGGTLLGLALLALAASLPRRQRRG